MFSYKLYVVTVTDDLFTRCECDALDIENVATYNSKTMGRISKQFHFGQ